MTSSYTRARAFFLCLTAVSLGACALDGGDSPTVDSASQMLTPPYGGGGDGEIPGDGECKGFTVPCPGTTLGYAICCGGTYQCVESCDGDGGGSGPSLGAPGGSGDYGGSGGSGDYGAGYEGFLGGGQGHPCGGFIAGGCGEGLYCEMDEGLCHDEAAQGTCQPKPNGCYDLYEPVCGCDGATYSNDCEAAAAGVNVDRPGTCDGKDDDDDRGRQCGGWGGFECRDDEFCRLDENQCSVADAAGTCVPRSDGCTEQYDPVCGCDGVTYSNQCHADLAGAQVDHSGECQGDGGDDGGDDGDGAACGGLRGLQCAEGYVCQYEPGMCFVSDAMGTCVAGGDGCTEQYDPVCGCDGVTYSNQCHADLAGAQVDHSGECQGDGGDDGDGAACGGLLGLQCAKGYVCQYEPGMCFVSDAMGTCVAGGDGCTEQYDPVCGCDGVTYSNQCHANLAGAMVDYVGECKDEGGSWFYY